MDMSASCCMFCVLFFSKFKRKIKSSSHVERYSKHIICLVVSTCIDMFKIPPAAQVAACMHIYIYIYRERDVCVNICIHTYIHIYIYIHNQVTQHVSMLASMTLHRLPGLLRWLTIGLHSILPYHSQSPVVATSVRCVSVRPKKLGA